MIPHVIKLVLVQTTETSIIEQQSEQESPLILIISLFSTKRQQEIWTAIELFVNSPVAFIAERNTITKLKRPDG